MIKVMFPFYTDIACDLVSCFNEWFCSDECMCMIPGVFLKNDRNVGLDEAGQVALTFSAVRSFNVRAEDEMFLLKYGSDQDCDVKCEEVKMTFMQLFRKFLSTSSEWRKLAISRPDIEKIDAWLQSGSSSVFPQLSEELVGFPLDMMSSMCIKSNLAKLKDDMMKRYSAGCESGMPHDDVQSEMRDMFFKTDLKVKEMTGRSIRNFVKSFSVALDSLVQWAFCEQNVAGFKTSSAAGSKW